MPLITRQSGDKIIFFIIAQTNDTLIIMLEVIRVISHSAQRLKHSWHLSLWDLTSLLPRQLSLPHHIVQTREREHYQNVHAHHKIPNEQHDAHELTQVPGVPILITVICLREIN